LSQDPAAAFIEHLQRLSERDRGAMATLRHSLAFSPGDYSRAYPLVERFVAGDWHERDARRLARYAVAGLFATHPVQHKRSLAAALGQLVHDKQRPSLELRFITLLEADSDTLMDHLRQVVSLLAADGLGYDHAALLRDLAVALDAGAWPAARDQLKRRWARDFYRALQVEPAADKAAEPAATATNDTRETTP
jgi:CRISPR system Cascade subunit CasB